MWYNIRTTHDSDSMNQDVFLLCHPREACPHESGERGSMNPETEIDTETGRDPETSSG